MEQKPPKDRDAKLAEALRANLKRRKLAGKALPVKNRPEPEQP